MASHKPFQSINKDLTDELALAIEEHFVPHVTELILEFMKQNVSRKRGTKVWLDNLSRVGVLLALADDEQRTLIYRAIMSTRPSSTNLPFH